MGKRGNEEKKRYEPPQIKTLAASKAFQSKCQYGASPSGGGSQQCRNGGQASPCVTGNTQY